MKRTTRLFLIACALSASVVGAQQQMKPWAKWSEEYAKKILENSPWAQTQVQINTSQMFPNAGQGYIDPERSALDTSLPPNSVPPANLLNAVYYCIQFLSAKPVRQALVRVAELHQQNADPQVLKGLRDFVESKFDQWIVIAVTFESKNQRFSGPVMQMFSGATLGTLKNNTFLELSNGKHLFLEDYQAPTSEGLGAKFLFPRTVNGVPFITAESGKVRFFAILTSSEASRPLILNMQFKVADFRYEGALEY
jgi:hypothetical protein